MERRPHVLAQHRFEIIRAGFRQSLATNPAADEMDESIDPAKFSRDRFRGGMNRCSIAQFND